MTATLISYFPWTTTLRNADNESGKRLRRWTGLLLVTSIAGSAAGLSGVVLTILTHLSGVVGPNSRLPQLATILIVTSFALLLAASHCIDRMDAAEKESRLEYCRKHGLKDGEDTSAI